jgi:hypothetical protein
MGELLDALNATDENGVPAKSALDQAAELLRMASQKVNEAIEAVQEPGMPLDAFPGHNSTPRLGHSICDQQRFVPLAFAPLPQT